MNKVAASRGIVVINGRASKPAMDRLYFPSLIIRSRIDPVVARR